MTTLTTVFLLLSMTAAVVVGYGSRPPVDIDLTLCDHMVPIHGDPTAVGPPPYTLTATKGDDSTYTVRLAGKDSKLVQGFFIEARPWDSSSSSESTPADSVGTFASPSPGTHLIDCFDKTHNAWGQSNPDDKDGVEATWTAPAGYGDVRFRASVVEANYTSYWVELYSDVTTYNGAVGVRFSVMAPLFSLLLSFLATTRM